MQSRKHVLDTSSFQAMGRPALEAISQQVELWVSPFCFWEMLTHLEEPGRFERVKGNLMKFRYVKVLDDPQAVLDRTVVLPADSVLIRPNDGDLVFAALAALRDSGSVEAF